MIARRTHGSGPARGFTLLELLVSLALTMAVTAMVIRSFSAMSGAWRNVEARTDTFRGARAALDCMARDFGSIAPLPQGDSKPPMLVLDYDPATPGEDRFNEEAYAICSLPNCGHGDLCMAGYRSMWDGESRGYVLKRFFKESDALFQNFCALGKAPSTFQRLYSTDSAEEDDMAGIVWDLQFRPCVSNTPAAYPRASYSLPEELPRWIEIRFKTVGASAAEKLKELPVTRGTWTESNTAAPSSLYRNVILPAVQQFVLRVRIGPASKP